MNRTLPASKGLYRTDDSSATGLDVFRYEDKTAPPPDFGQGGDGGKDQPTIWSYYIQRGEQYDKDLVEDANNTVEVLLIFAGLFSAVVTAFISQTYPMLQQDDDTVLMSIYLVLRNSSTITALDKPFVAPPYAVRINCLLFSGLFTSMLVALLAILVKQWARSYERELGGISSPHLRARIRHFRYNGAQRWHLEGIVGQLSLLMHFAIFISASGIVDLLLSTAPKVGYVALSISAFGAILFFATTLLPVFVPDAPFRSPVSKFLSTLKRQLQPPRFPSRDKAAEAAKKEDLEDYVEQSQGEESDENIIVRTQVYLDLDIICHLLRTADKSTERWLLDLCFQKLPNLNHLEDRYPNAFHSRDIIIETYNFLIQGCINRRAGMINPERLLRARQLCEFVSWYLCLPQTEDEWKKLSQTLDRKGDSTLLATLLAKDEGYPNILAALTALGHLAHFRRRHSRNKCPVCSTETSEVAVDWTGGQSIEPQEERMRRLLSLLIMRTDCILLGHKNGFIPDESTEDECQDSRKAIQQALPQSGLTEKDKKLWIQALSEREIKASLSFKEAWFTPLTRTLSGLQPTRSAPFRPSGNAPGRDSANLRPPAAPYLHPGTSSNGPATHATDSPHAPVDTPLTIPTILLSRPSLVL